MKRLITYMALIQMIVLLAACQETDKISAESSPERVAQPEVETQAQSSPPVERQHLKSAEETAQPPLEPQAAQPAEITGDVKLVSNNEIYYSRQNGLEYRNDIYIGTYESGRCAQGIHIEGLRDRAVQKKINDRIKEEALSLYQSGLPPYRGIYALLSGDWDEGLELQVDGTIYYNRANVLSMALKKVIMSRGDNIYITMHVPLTFDLNTGELIPLSDLFAPGTDYQKELSDYVSSGISDNELYSSMWGGYYGSEEREGVTLIQPFDNIKETQKYIIASNNQIILLLDYETPEFDVGMDTRFLPIRAEVLEESGVRFVYASTYENAGDSLYTGEYRQEKELTNDHLMDSQAYNLSSSGMKDKFPVEYLEILISTARIVEDEGLARKISAAAKQPDAHAAAALAADQITLKNQGNFLYSYTTQKYGHYLNEYERYYVWSGENENYNKSRYKVYDTLTGQQLYLKDCFVPGSDYINVLTAKVMEEYQEGDADEIRVSLAGAEFSIYSQGLEIYMDDDWLNYFYIQFDELEEHISLFD